LISAHFLLGNRMHQSCMASRNRCSVTLHHDLVDDGM